MKLLNTNFGLKELECSRAEHSRRLREQAQLGEREQMRHGLFQNEVNWTKTGGRPLTVHQIDDLPPGDRYNFTRDDAVSLLQHMTLIQGTPFGCRRCNRAFSRIHNLDAHILAYRRNEPGAAAAAGVDGAQARADRAADDQRAADDRAAENERAAADRENLTATVDLLIGAQGALENVAKAIQQEQRGVAETVQVMQQHGKNLAAAINRLDAMAAKLSAAIAKPAAGQNRAAIPSTSSTRPASAASLLLPQNGTERQRSKSPQEMLAQGKAYGKKVNDKNMNRR